nr:glycine--tRNA ligase, chloroplastic/mitochondrial 2 isoform X2 [Tanacetum cinerariifolium]
MNVTWYIIIYSCYLLISSFDCGGNVSHGLRNTSSATVMQQKKIIIEQSNDLAKGVDECLVMKSCLLNECFKKNYCAYVDVSCKPCWAPVHVLGKFSESFLMHPKDLLLMVMQKHQKYFTLTDDKENLLPCYIVVK